MTKRTKRITVQRDRVWIIRHCGVPVREWCEHCGAEVEVVTLEQACAFPGVTPEAILNWTASTKLHAASDGAKPVRICLPSLLESITVPKTLRAIQGS